jgi:hypothetical protein
MREGIGKSFHGFIAIREDGALMGPWNPWLHEAHIGKPIWELTNALSQQSRLPDPARQIAILVTGAHFRAAYEIYAHVAIAEHDNFRMRSSPPSSRGSVRPISPAMRPLLTISPLRSRVAVCCLN